MVVWLCGCMVVLLYGGWVVWLLGCWVVGLLDCVFVGLLGCLVVLLSKIGPKSVPKGSQKGPKDVQHGYQKGPPEGLMTLGALGAFFGIFVHGFLVLLGRFGCHFGGQWGPIVAPELTLSDSLVYFSWIEKLPEKQYFPEPSKIAEVGPNVVFIQGFILFSAPIHVVSGDKMMILGGPSKIIFFQKWTHGGARFGKQCIKRGCQQLRSLFLFDVLPFCEKLQMCDFWLFHFNEITAAKIKISSFLVRFFNFCARIFCALGPFWVPFGGPVGSRGGPKSELLGTKSAQRGSKRVFRRGGEKAFEK